MTQYVTHERTQELRDILAEKLLEAEHSVERIDVVYDLLEELGIYCSSGEGLFVTSFGQGYEAGYQAAAAKAYQAAAKGYQAALRLAYPYRASPDADADAADAEGGE